MLVACGNAHADQQAPVDEDFLEYLGTVDDGGDWTLFEDQDSQAPKAKQQPADKTEDDAKSAPKPAKSK